MQLAGVAYTLISSWKGNHKDRRLTQSILEVAALLRKREVSPLDLTRDCLARVAAQNPSLNAFITVTAESALEQARQAEAEIQRGDWRGPLHGVPIALKDLIDVAGVPTTAGSTLFKNRLATEDAEIVARLRNAGAVLLGKQNLHEFAYGGSSVISAYGPVRNAWNAEYIAGGSSGGSATSVAAGLCFATLGTDTAGSVREPAALCGVVGLKPTFNLVSARRVFPLAPSFDHVGPITRTVADAALMLQVIAGDEQNYLDAITQDARTLRVAVPRAFFFEGLDDEVSAAVEEALRVISKITASVRDIKLDVNPDRTLQAAESFAVHADYVARSPELYQPETLRRIRTGENTTAAEVEKLRTELQNTRRDIQGVFEDQNIDVLITPTTPIPAPRLADLQQNPDQLRPREVLLLRNTRPFNVWGLPAISVSCGFTKDGLPIGLQIAGGQGAEKLVLQLSHAYEQATDWHRRQPAQL
jgi:aspartyl-tRNA(Asn)/glutamyl-tRNA(Gln) amidotransferase subunit A